MAAIGGPVQEVSIDGRLFQSASDADVNIDLGGYSSEMAPNGDGKTARDIMSAKPWKVDGLQLVVDHDRGDQQFVQEKANTPGGRFPVSITLVSGTTLRGVGKPTGDIKSSTKDAVMSLEISGPGELEVQ